MMGRFANSLPSSRRSDDFRHLAQGQAMGAQGVLGNLDADFKIPCAAQVDAGDLRVLQKLVAHGLGHFTQHALLQVAVDGDGQGPALVRGHDHLRGLGVFGK